jgi:hypothetical protein
LTDFLRTRQSVIEKVVDRYHGKAHHDEPKEIPKPPSFLKGQAYDSQHQKAEGVKHGVEYEILKDGERCIRLRLGSKYGGVHLGLRLSYREGRGLRWKGPISGASRPRFFRGIGGLGAFIARHFWTFRCWTIWRVRYFCQA